MTRTNSCNNRAHTHAEEGRLLSPWAKWAELWEILDAHFTERQWSPEDISGKLAQNTPHRVSHELIYLYICDDRKAGGFLYQHLRQSRRTRKSRRNTKDMRETIKQPVSINLRPPIVEQKIRLGDLEMDAVIVVVGGPVLVTIVDRVCKYTLRALALFKKSGRCRRSEVGGVIYGLLKDYRRKLKSSHTTMERNSPTTIF